MENYDRKTLIQTLWDCVTACENCATACLHEQDVQSMVRCISLDRDCADICSQGARLLARNSEVAYQYLVICEGICRMCAHECSMHPQEHCQKCAEACFICAEACHEHHQPLTQD